MTLTGFVCNKKQQWQPWHDVKVGDVIAGNKRRLSVHAVKGGPVDPFNPRQKKGRVIWPGDREKGQGRRPEKQNDEAHESDE